MTRRPQVPRALLPRSREGFGPSLAGSAVIHALIVVALMWRAGSPGDYVDVIGGLGPAGGGGSEVRYVELFPPASAPPTAPVVTARPATAFVLPTPKVSTRPKDTPVFALPTDATPVVLAPRPGQDAGSRRGSGQGTGVGSGVGSGEGPGTGGGAGGIATPPEPRQIVLPPDAPSSMKGLEYTVRLWIDTRGRVTNVEVNPPIDDAGYRKKFRERMYQLLFYPARDASGQPVNARYVITVMP